jgi:hypothetical protein
MPTIAAATRVIEAEKRIVVNYEEEKRQKKWWMGMEVELRETSSLCTRLASRLNVASIPRLFASMCVTRSSVNIY